MGINTALTIISIVVVVAVLAVAAWVLLIGPIVVPYEHAKHEQQLHH